MLHDCILMRWRFAVIIMLCSVLAASAGGPQIVIESPAGLDAAPRGDDGKRGISIPSKPYCDIVGIAKDLSGVTSVTVNGELAQLDRRDPAKVKFTKRVKLTGDKTPVVVQTTSSTGEFSGIAFDLLMQQFALRGSRRDIA